MVMAGGVLGVFVGPAESQGPNAVVGRYYSSAAREMWVDCGHVLVVTLEGNADSETDSCVGL
jgi:hypothetical protein